MAVSKIKSSLAMIEIKNIAITTTGYGGYFGEYQPDISKNSIVALYASGSQGNNPVFAYMTGGNPAKIRLWSPVLTEYAYIRIWYIP